MTDTSARDRYIQALMSHIAEDEYPSTTQMDMVEAVLGREQIEPYVRVLSAKVEQARFPSVPMMRRIARLVQST
jgi:hypothetical protein